MRQRTLYTAVALVMIVTCALVPAAGARGTATGGRPDDTVRPGEAVRVVSSGETGVTFEVAVPWARLAADPAAAAGSGGYEQVSIPGWSATSQAGAPGAAHDRPSDQRTLWRDRQRAGGSGSGPYDDAARPGPACRDPDGRMGSGAAREGMPALPKPSTAVAEDPAVYSGEAAYPGVLAKVASDGVVRQQRVVGIAAYPVQYQPATRELTVYEWLKVTVTFAGPAASSGDQPSAGSHPEAPAAESAAYEKLFGQELLNHGAARAWRQPAAPTSLLRPGAIEAGQTLPQRSRPRSAPTPARPVCRGRRPPPAGGSRSGRRASTGSAMRSCRAAGVLANNPDPRTFRLYNLGGEVAISVSGEADGHFDPADSIVFYGRPVASKYTRDNVYWLTYGGATGRRMASRNGAPGSAATPTSYGARRRLESNTVYVSGAPGDDNLERWLWDYLYPPSRPSWSHTFRSPRPTRGLPATLTVALLGWLDERDQPRPPRPGIPERHAVG